MPSFRQKFSSLYKKNQYDRFDRGSSSGQHILQDSLSDDTALSDDEEFASAPTPIHEYDGKEPLRGIISDFGDVKNHKVITHSSYSSDMDIIGAKTIDESGVNISLAFNEADNNNQYNSRNSFDDNIRLIHSPNGSTSPIQFITKPSIKQSKTFHNSKQFTSSYNVKGEGRSDIRKYEESNNQSSSRKSFDGTFFRSHGSRAEMTQSASLTSISAIAPGYTITKKASFKLFPTINLGDDENIESNVFFDLEKPKKGDGKEKKKLKKRLLAFLYKSSIFSLVFFLLSIFVFFTVSAVNSSDDLGYYTNGSPTTLLWISGLDLLLVIVIIFELFISLFILRIYTLVKKEKPKELVNIDSYFSIFVYRMVIFLFFGILFLINFTCYSLFVESRDHLAGWISCYGLVPLISFFLISYNQYNVFKNERPLDYDGEMVTFNLNCKNITCLSIGLLIKFISLIAFCCIGTMMILFTIQAIALVDDIEKPPGIKYPITIDHHTYNIHMYCEGNLKSPYIALVDADIGIPSPYEYMKPLITSLSKQNIRACVIERGGYGFSDTGPLPRDGNHTLSEIVSTIYESRMRTPFLYIAHSSASFTARALAHEYPELLSGMILLHPSHEDQELILLKQVKNLTDTEIQIRKDTRDYIDDVIRYVNPIALPRLFKYFHFEFLLEYEDPYELYYMNGWKSYFDEFLNLTLHSINRKVIFQNKYTGCVWSELKHFQSDTAESIKYLRFKSSLIFNNSTTINTNNTTSTMNNSTTSTTTIINTGDNTETRDDDYKKIPTVILTARNLLDGNCESNHYKEGSNMCSNFNIWKEGRAQAIKKLHGDLAKFYNAKWDLIESSYDLPIDVPDVIAKYARNLFLKSIKS